MVKIVSASDGSKTKLKEKPPKTKQTTQERTGSFPGRLHRCGDVRPGLHQLFRHLQIPFANGEMQGGAFVVLIAFLVGEHDRRVQVGFEIEDKADERVVALLHRQNESRVAVFITEVRVCASSDQAGHYWLKFGEMRCVILKETHKSKEFGIFWEGEVTCQTFVFSLNKKIREK